MTELQTRSVGRNGSLRIDSHMNVTEAWISEIANSLRDIGLAVDTYDEELLLSRCAEDARFDFGDRFNGSPKDFMAFMRASRPTTIAMSHVISNVDVEFESHFRALSRATVRAKIVRSVGDSMQDRAVTGHYEDEWSRNTDAWLLRVRRYCQIDEHIAP